MAGDQREDLVRKMIAEGTSDDDIRATLKVYDAQHQTAAPAADKPYLSAVKDRFLSGVQHVMRDPSVGAVLGSTLAAGATGGLSIPLQIGAAALGGGVGAKAFGADTPTAIKEGALSGAGEGIGQGVARVVKGGAKLVYKTALRPSMGLQREFGDIAATGLKEGVPVSEGGVRTVDAARGASAQRAAKMISAAAPTAPPIRVATEVGKETIPIMQRAGLRAATGLPDESGDIVQRVRAMQHANPGGITLEQAQKMKGELQDLASQVYRAQDKGAAITNLGADTNAAMARGLRGAIEQRVPGLDAVNGRTQDLIGLQRAMEDATRRNVPGVGSLRSLLGDFMPATASSLAIGADRAAPAAPTLLRALLARLGAME